MGQGRWLETTPVVMMQSGKVDEVRHPSTRLKTTSLKFHELATGKVEFHWKKSEIKEPSDWELKTTPRKSSGSFETDKIVLGTF